MQSITLFQSLAFMSAKAGTLQARACMQIDGMVEEVVLDHLHATAFQHTPLGRTILGSAQNIQSMTKEDVEAYIRAHYTAGAHARTCGLAHMFRSYRSYVCCL